MDQIVTENDCSREFRSNPNLIGYASALKNRFLFDGIEYVAVGYRNMYNVLHIEVQCNGCQADYKPTCFCEFWHRKLKRKEKVENENRVERD